MTTDTPREAIRRLIGPAPTAGGTLAAQTYHRALMRVLNTRPCVLPRAVRHALQKLERKWRRRADGDDPRWLAVGSQPGRLPQFLEYALRPPAADYIAPPTDEDFPRRPKKP